MKVIAWCVMFLPSLLWAQGEAVSAPHQSSSAAANSTSETEETYRPEEPQAPESIEKRARDAKGLFAQRAIREAATVDNPFVLTPHKPTYFLPISYSNSMEDETFLGDKADTESLDNLEFTFQVSLKFPLAYGIVGRNTSLWVGYTQRSYWQAYNSNISSPFRDTNYEPEVFISTKPKWDLFGVKPEYVIYGFVHQSNGQSGELSRSWNRVYADILFEKGNTAFSIKPWYRLPESKEIDDNPNIERYYGYGEFSMIHIIGDYSIDAMIRNNLRLSGNKGSLQLGFNFPLWGRSRGYVQYFNGYGQSLLDYDHHTQSVGLGIMLTNWL
ncbi:phospholipase A [Marinomonas transparens]|uniref:Phospholipase A1 n=1 Tax=Marinomonas transparens TaxID=2795388 RepID=A0A934JSR9_9GAMM|nr:phospholipase A [Marinomonas transparens]MBJ7536705.1 phospholipase A [Marinomonas transparens]